MRLRDGIDDTARLAREIGTVDLGTQVALRYSPHNRPHRARRRFMTRVLFAALFVLTLGLALGGCRAEGEIDTDAATHVAVPR